MTGNHRDTSAAAATEAGRAALTAFDDDLHARAWSPRGSAALLAGALFVDALPVAVVSTPARAA